MLNILRRIIIRSVVVGSVALLAACGSSGGDSPPPPPPPPPPPLTAAGVFIDSAVQGLTYKSGSNTAGTTDASGSFTYTVGETLSFSVGGVALGTLVDGQSLVTPYDFPGATENIARFLQTLDADGVHSNGINLTAAAAALAATEVDASIFIADASTFEANIAPIVETALGTGVTLVDAATAMANLAAATDSTFELAELDGQVLVIEIPDIAEFGIALFAPVANPGDTGSTVELLMSSDTLAESGDGTTTVMEWSLDNAGVLSFIDPEDSSVITITKIGGSIGLIETVLSDGTDEFIGHFLIPAAGTAEDIHGGSSRTFITMDDYGTGILSFFESGNVSRTLGDVVTVQNWELDPNGSLVTISDGISSVAFSVVVNGNFAVGGEFVTVYATDLSGDPSAPILQLDELQFGSITPFATPDPGEATVYQYSTAADASGPDPSLNAIFAGAVVSGSFAYADWAPAVAIATGPSAPGSTIYVDVLLDHSGSVNGLTYADASGVAFVGNERFVDLGSTDFLFLGSGPVDSGFEAGGYTLTGVRLYWIEGDTTTEDFLTSDLLPGTLPGLPGRLALDFVSTGDPNVTASVFFQGLSVTPAP